MNPLALAPLLMAAVAIYVGIANLLDLYYFKRDRVHLWFGITSFSVALYDTMCYMAYTSKSVEEGVIWQTGQYSATIIIMIFFMRFLFALAGRKPGIGYALHVVFCLTALMLVLFTDLATSVDRPAIKVVEWANLTYYETSGGPVVDILYPAYAYAMIFGFYMVWKEYRKGDQTVRIILVALALFFASVFNDILVDSTLLNSIYVQEYFFAFLIVAMSNSISARYLRTHHALEALQVELEDRVEQRTQELQLARNEAIKLLEEAQNARAESDRLLHSILPSAVVTELKETGRVEPLFFDMVTVLFTDFVGFSERSRGMLPNQLIEELDGCFSQFDEIIKRYGLEKLKTIGDAYMCAAGVPQLSPTHAIDACLAALEIRSFMVDAARIRRESGLQFWPVRLGIHSGPVTAGVIGTQKFAYDIWGETVNLASRLEAHSEPDQINISKATWELVKELFEGRPRGLQEIKGAGPVEMVFLEGLRSEYSMGGQGKAPNGAFLLEIEKLKAPWRDPSVTIG